MRRDPIHPRYGGSDFSSGRSSDGSYSPENAAELKDRQLNSILVSPQMEKAERLPLSLITLK
jgi:hypothetical protein